MTDEFVLIIAVLARLRNIELRPDWADRASSVGQSDERGLYDFCDVTGWPRPHRYSNLPRSHEFPVLAWHSRHGWAVAERLEDGGRVAVQGAASSSIWALDDDCVLYDLTIPLPPRQRPFDRAIQVFVHAIFERKHYLVVAAFATVVINFLALATSLYSMQVYDRVVPRGGIRNAVGVEYRCRRRADV